MWMEHSEALKSVVSYNRRRFEPDGDFVKDKPENVFLTEDYTSYRKEHTVAMARLLIISESQTVTGSLVYAGISFIIALLHDVITEKRMKSTKEHKMSNLIISWKTAHELWPLVYPSIFLVFGASTKDTLQEFNRALDPWCWRIIKNEFKGIRLKEEIENFIY